MKTDVYYGMIWATLHTYGDQRELRLSPRPVPPTAPYDGVMCNKTGVSVELAQVKLRPSPKDKYPTLKIEKKRIDQLITFAKAHNIRAVLVVNWMGNINWLNLTEIEAENGGLDALFPEATIKRRRPEEEDRVCYCIDTVLFRSGLIQPYQVTA